MLTIAYMTNRKDCKIKWFFESLDRQLQPADEVKVVVVDFHAPDARIEWLDIKPTFIHTAPKPNPWQGPHRLTKENWFAAANSRNTAVCLAPDGYIAFVDDLSVLLPGWLDCVKQAQRENYIALGAYKKVKKLVVENGEVKSFEENPSGVDSRLHHVHQDQTSTDGSWFYGCSVAMPVEAVLEVNGFPEDLCGGLGFEDVCFGIALGNTNKYSFRYDRRMMTYESEEDHFVEPPFKKTDKGQSPNDKSHAALAIARNSKWFPNQYNLRELRQSVLAGNPFPLCGTPDRDWYDGQLLSEM